MKIDDWCFAFYFMSLVDYNFAHILFNVESHERIQKGSRRG